MTAIEFNTQITNLQNHLNYFAFSLTKNDDDAKDLVQDTLLKAITNKDKFDDDTNLKAWTYTIMKNTFINAYRRKIKTNTMIDYTDDTYFINSSIMNNYTPTDNNYSIKEIVKSIKEIKFDQRKPFEMHVAGFKYKEIADNMNISIGTVKSRIFFTRKKLMERLKEYES